MAEPLTLRYNNPGAVEYQDWMRPWGARPGPNGRYAQFDTPDQGYGVMSRVLDTYRDKHGLNTVSGIVGRWAPENVDNNSTSTYVQKVAGLLGVNPDESLKPEHRMPLMQAMAQYEAGKAPAPVGGVSSLQSSASASPASPQPQQRPTGMGLLDTLVNGMQSPLFQSGAAMVNAGAQGQNFGGGLLAGSEAAAKARAQQLQMLQAKRQMEAQAARDQMWSQMGQGQTPPWAANLPSGALDLARIMGPDAGAKFLTDMTLKGSERGLERERLGVQSQHYRNIEEQQRQQAEETRSMGEERRLLMQAQRDEYRRKQAEAEAKARRDAEIWGTQPPPAAPAGGAPPAGSPPVQPRPPMSQPGVKPMSAPVNEDTDGEDPNLIRTQAVDPQAPAAPPSQPPQAKGMIQTPRGMMPPDQARELAMKMLTVPEYHAAGQAILKQIEQTGDERGLDKTARGEVEKGMVSGINHIARLRDIAQQFDPKFLKIGYRSGQTLSSFLETTGKDMTPDQQQDHIRYVQFRAAAAGNVNALLKELSGSAVTQNEYERMLIQEPNAGQGGITESLWGFDNPTRFKAKLEQSIKMATLAVARANYLRSSRSLSDADIAKLAKSGELENAVSIPGIEKIMQRERERVEGQLRGRDPNADEETIRQGVRQHMKGVFGI